MSGKLSRRSALKTMAASAAFMGVSPAFGKESGSMSLKGNIRHSACKWCYPKLSLDEFATAAKEIGLEGIDLLDLKDIPTLQKYGLTCAIANGPSTIPEGFNRIENHAKYVPAFKELIPQLAKLGVPNVITFSGNRNGMSDEQGLQNCVVGLKQIMSTAEQHGVTVIVELLNSKVNHKDYMCDHTAWGAELCRQVGSERLKLLYDIYHMQIMEGDIIRTIKENAQYIGHYHTGGNPGRNEIDDTQEIYYPAVMKAIVETGYKGFVAQEFVPGRGKDPLTSLRQAVQICDV